MKRAFIGFYTSCFGADEIQNFRDNVLSVTQPRENLDSNEEVESTQNDEVFYEPFEVSNAKTLFEKIKDGTQRVYQDADGKAACALLPLGWQNEQDGIFRPLRSNGRKTKFWVKGGSLEYGMALNAGTVLASGWIGDRYMSMPEGNHTVIFQKWGIKDGKMGMWVAEQMNTTWEQHPRISFKTFGKGTYVDNASQFSIVTFMRVRNRRPSISKQN